MPESADTPKANGRAPMQDSEAQNAECQALEDTLARLRAAYEQYFLGVDRQPPSQLHRTFKERLERLKNAFVRATAVRFRIGNLAQKASTYERLWSRTLVEIENGTYRRDLFKARRKQQLAKEQAKDKASTGTEKAESPSGVAPAPEAVAAAAPPRVAPNAPVSARPAAGGSSALSEARIRDIYDAYVAAKRKCNEDVSKLTVESLASTLRKQMPDLMKKHQSQGVDFKVVIKDGKAVLRAVPK